MKILYKRITNCAACPNYWERPVDSVKDPSKYGACKLLATKHRIGLLAHKSIFDFDDDIHYECLL